MRVTGEFRRVLDVHLLKQWSEWYDGAVYWKAGFLLMFPLDEIQRNAALRGMWAGFRELWKK